MRLKEALKKGEFAVISEVRTPIGEEPEELIKRLELVRGRVDGVTVSELDIEGVVGDSIKFCDLLKKNRFEPYTRQPPETRAGHNCRRISSLPMKPASKIYLYSLKIIGSLVTACRK